MKMIYIETEKSNCTYGECVRSMSGSLLVHAVSTANESSYVIRQGLYQSLE